MAKIKPILPRFQCRDLNKQNQRPLYQAPEFEQYLNNLNYSARVPVQGNVRSVARITN